MSSELLAGIGTRSEQLATIAQLDLIIEQLYRTQSTFEQSVESIASSQLAEKLIALYKGQTSVPLLRKQLQLLVDEVSHMESIELRVAYEPTRQMGKEIVSWVKEHVHSDCLVEFVYVPDLVGGVAISYAGKYVDLSFKNKLLGFFTTQSDWIRSYFVL